MFKLVIQDDEGKTTVVPLIRDEITIGRKEGNTIRLTERNVSRRHARILRNNGEVQIEDLGSYNGIRVNNARIAERVSLRVSDQVQIGDYKLYLKAEGVEQVDDARTMPIERVDTANTATDVIAVPPAVAAAAPAPTAPMMATPAPGTLPPAAQLVGNPNRTLVAIADTDPGGRPVASPAQVAAVLAPPSGYGKLVVLSSNFAGKEFELSRPQMIIGRTDENDIVVNHRSISRNHAKLVREPDTGRYTISDLQSSNGVRVNGQDYGKVELRRGDVVDLGHVRLRFVEAGEDFVFARDAVITDVPDTSKSKTLFIAIGLAALVVVGVVVFVLMKDGDKKGAKNGSNDIAVAQDAAAVAMTDDAGVEDPVEIDAAPTVAPPPDNVAETLEFQCRQLIDQKKWPDVIECSEKLKPHDKAKAAQIWTLAHSEQKAEATKRKFDDALRDGDLKAASARLNEIDKDSVYKKDAQAAWDEAEKKAIAQLVVDAKKNRSADCKDFNQFMRQANASLPPSIVNAAKRDVTCVPAKPDKPDKPDKPEPCNHDELLTKAKASVAAGANARAVGEFEDAYNCRKDAQTMKLIFMAACKAKNTAKAKAYWKRMNQGTKDQVLTICVGNGITADVLDAP